MSLRGNRKHVRSRPKEQRERGLASFPHFLLASCQICDHPLPFCRSNGLRTFVAPWASPQVKKQVRKHRATGVEHILPRTEDKQMNDRMTSEYVNHTLCAKSPSTTRANETAKKSLKLQKIRSAQEHRAPQHALKQPSQATPAGFVATAPPKGGSAGNHKHRDQW
jgi:hypothetical protein